MSTMIETQPKFNYNLKMENKKEEEDDNNEEHFFLKSPEKEDDLSESSDKSTEQNDKKSKNSFSEDADFMRNLLGNKINEEEKPKVEINQILISLDQITLNGGNKFNYFPIINIPKNKYEIEIPEKILNKGDYFTAFIENTENTLNLIPENCEIVNIYEFCKYFSDKDNSYVDILKELYDDLNCHKRNTISLVKIIENLYSKAEGVIGDIIRNVKNRKTKSIIEKLSLRLNTIINIHNEIYADYLIKNKIEIPVNEEKKDKGTYQKIFYEKNENRLFECEICHKKCISCQALGGHMSKNHPDQSEKYKMKINIRKNRENQRNRLEEVKKKLFEDYKLDYNLMKVENKKIEIKQFLKKHYEEYNQIKTQMYKKEKMKFF